MLNVRRSGAGAPIVLIHGVAGSAAIWDAITPQLSEHFEVWRLDLLGYGYSPKPKVRYTAEAHVKAIHDTLETMKIPKPYSLIGLSMGAMLAILYATTYPEEVDAIIAIGLPLYHSAEEARLSLRQSFWTKLVVQYPLVARLLIPWAWPLSRRSKWLRKKLGPTIYSDTITYESALATYHSFSSTVNEVMVNFRVEPLLPKVDAIRKLYIQGGSDQWTPAADIRRLIEHSKNAELREVGGTAHNIVVLAPDQTAAMCIEFLERTKN